MGLLQALARAVLRFMAKMEARIHISAPSTPWYRTQSSPQWFFPWPKEPSMRLRSLCFFLNQRFEVSPSSFGPRIQLVSATHRLVKRGKLH